MLATNSRKKDARSIIILFMDDLKLYGKNGNQIDSLVQTLELLRRHWKEAWY